MGERTKRGDVVFIERLGVFSEHDIPIVWGRGGGYPRTVAPNQFFFLDRGPVFLLLVGRPLDAQLAIRVASKRFGFVIAIADVGTLIVLFDGSP